ARSATTPAAWPSRARVPRTRARSAPTAGRSRRSWPTWPTAGRSTPRPTSRAPRRRPGGRPPGEVGSRRPSTGTPLMRRTLAIALTGALAAAALLAPQSGASGLVKHRFTAPLQGGGNNAGLQLNAFYKKGVPNYVTDLTWENVSCGGPFAGVQHWRVD